MSALQIQLLNSEMSFPNFIYLFIYFPSQAIRKSAVITSVNWKV